MRRLHQPILATLACLLGLSAYPAERVQAAERSSHVAVLREALHAESLGLPRQVSARGDDGSESPLAQAYAGKIKRGKEWLSIDEAIARLSQDAKLADYQQHLAKTRETADDHVKLANWCKVKGLREQEQAHLLRALDFEPDNAAIRERLGHVRGEQQWLSREQVAAKQQLVAAKAAWLPKLRELRQGLKAGNTGLQQAARDQFLLIRDPLAVEALDEILGSDKGDSLLLIQILSRIDDPLSGQVLVRLAVDSENADVRLAAREQLPKLDRYATVPLLLSQLRGDVTTNVSLIPVRRGASYTQRIVRTNQDFDENLVVNVDVYRAGGDPRANFAVNEALARRVQEENDALAQRVNEENLKTSGRNERIAAALVAATGQDLGNKAQAWWEWWKQETEVSEQKRRAQLNYQRTLAVVMSDQTPWADPKEIPSSFQSSSQFQSERLQQRYECFVAGTPVWTSRGKVEIEKIRTGELVLTQNVQSGQLEFKPVVRPTTRPAMQLVSLTIGGESFTCTGGHLFWVVEQGWVKARDLQVGTVVHGANGAATVTSNEAGPSSPTFNLVMADNHNYFVGQSRLLTHDNTPRQATSLVAPGVPADEP